MFAFLLAAAVAQSDIDEAGRALANWDVCVQLQALGYSRSSEPAETVATAALSKCVDQQEQARDKVLRSLAGPDVTPYVDIHKEADETISDYRAKLRDKAIAMIIDARMKK